MRKKIHVQVTFDKKKKLTKYYYADQYIGNSHVHNGFFLKSTMLKKWLLKHNHLLNNGRNSL
jgi:hypothetical protein